MNRDLPGHIGGSGGATALIGNVHHAGVRLVRQQRAGKRRRLPVPNEPQVSSPGRALASTITSRTLFAGSEGCASINIGVQPTYPSSTTLRGSYGSVR